MHGSKIGETMKYFARFFIIPAILLVGFIGCSRTVNEDGDPVSYVDPMIGTGGHGHTFPGATVPFGMVQVSPDTRDENWDGSSGYHYSDKTIMGFSQTHLSGTGAPEFCDVLFMPTVGKVQVKVGDANDPSTGYRSAFDHANEQASAGYYSVLLDDYGVKAELTATKRTAFHRYTFPASTESNIIIDLQSRGRVVGLNIEFLSDREIQGLRRSSGWAKDQYVYFYAKFNTPFSAFGIALDDSLVEGRKSASGKNIKAFVRYETKQDEPVLVKIGISAVSCDGARKNLEAENDGWDFNAVAARAKADWNDYLSKITVEGGTKKQRRIFYTALYHTAVSPNLFMDVDGQFRGVDHQVHRADGFTNYTVFSLWDTFRALMPLYTIIEPERSADFIRTFLSMYRIGGRLPKWEIAGNYSGAMIGFHSLPVILDAYAKGIRDFDADLALQAMKASMQSGGPALTFFRNLGFIPADKDVGSVSKSVEYAYNAWCVYKMAEALGDQNDAEVYGQYTLFYRNQFDPSTGFMRPKNYNRTWFSPFDPAEGSEHYVEGNAYQYSLFAPQDVDGLIRLIGGDGKFIDWLDALFTTTSKYDDKVVDAAGLIGQYAHGNEPSHNLAYLYSYAGAPWKTQAMLRRILDQRYNDQPDGLSGNEDCGQMSAWYVLSAAGFYPACPGEPSYVIGSPIFDSITFHLENGKQFAIRAEHVSKRNKYIHSATMNGKTWKKSWFTHADILNGGELVLDMGSSPNKAWGALEADRPHSEKFGPVIQMPYLISNDLYFLDAAKIILACDTDGADIHYTLDGRTPTKSSPRYTAPFTVKKTTIIKFRAFKQGFAPTPVARQKFLKINYTSLKNYENNGEFKSGLHYDYFEGLFAHVADMDGLKPLRSGVMPKFDVMQSKDVEQFGYTFSGFIKIPKDGIYTFYNKTNDGSILYLDGKEFINMDGGHPAYVVSRTIALRAGVYRIKQKYFQIGGGIFDQVDWEGPGIEREEIPAEALFHK